MSRFDPNTGAGGQQLPGDLIKFLSKVRIGAVYVGTCTQTGGSAGNKTTLCSFTYTVTTLAGIVVAKAAGPLCSRARIVKCAVTAGTKCSFYYDAARVVHMWEVDEVATQTNC